MSYGHSSELLSILRGEAIARRLILEARIKGAEAYERSIEEAPRRDTEARRTFSEWRVMDLDLLADVRENEPCACEPDATSARSETTPQRLLARPSWMQ